MYNINKLLILAFLVMSIGCSKDDNTIETPILEKSDAKELLVIAFKLDTNPDLASEINGSVEKNNKSALLTLPIGTSLTNLTPTIQISDKATYSPKGAQDFSNDIVYTITAEDGSTANYVVKVEVSESSESELVRFIFREVDNGIPETVEGFIDTENASVRLVTTTNTDLTSLVPQLEVSEGASYAPQGIQNFSEPVIYTITAADGTQSEYTLDVKTERDLLIAIAEANPNHTLDWHLADANIENWDVELNENGYVEELYLNFANLSELPDEIGFFKKLKELDLSENPFTKLPKSIGNLSNLIELDLEETNLKELPGEFTQLEALNELYLDETLFQEFPEEIFQLTNLIRLQYQENQLKELPKEIGNLKNLEELFLNNNLLFDLPDEIRFLTSLNEIYLSGNQFEEIPLELIDLQDLETIGLINNLLSNLPDEVQFMDGLKTFYLGKNQFEEIPKVLFTLNSLVTLYMEDNVISEIPPVIESLTNLNTFAISNNLLKSIPSELVSIQSLRNLFIAGNSIEILPEELCARTDVFITKDDSTICED
ncbi:hypothetical protein GH721_09605 [Kriegella sp. EG-1]|nr:hypothetical protein [Flavobacteriaceae bacterium EG-1]